MPITEIVTPSLKQDAETRTIFTAILDSFSPLIQAQGQKKPFFGQMILENDINVEGDFNMALGLEWENSQSFYDFLASDKFKAFGAKIKPLVLSPPAPQIYETDTSPVEAFSSPVTAVTRIRVEDDQKLEEVRTIWARMIDALQSKLGKVVSLSGPSLNLEAKIFLGVIGWDTLEGRQNAMMIPGVEEAKGELGSLGGVSEFVVRFVAE